MGTSLSETVRTKPNLYSGCLYFSGPGANVRILCVGGMGECAQVLQIRIELGQPPHTTVFQGSVYFTIFSNAVCLETEKQVLMCFCSPTRLLIWTGPGLELYLGINLGAVNHSQSP